MKTRSRWGMVVVAVIFTVVAVGTAFGTYFFEKQKGAGGLVAARSDNPNDADGDGLMSWEEIVWHTDPANPDTDGDGVTDGKEVAAQSDPAIAGKGADTYADWSGSTPTERFISDLAIVGGELAAKNASSEETDVAVKAVVAGFVQPDLTEKIPLSALDVGTSTSLGVYTQLTLLILKQSAQVREYELTTFKRTIENQSYSGTSALKDAATSYKKIEAAMLVTEVPESVAAEHLAVVNSVGTLANVINAMAMWSGDAVAALTYVNLFIKAEDAVGSSVENLFAKITLLLEETT